VAGRRTGIAPREATADCKRRQHPHAADRGPPDPPVRPPAHRDSPSRNSPIRTHWLLGAVPLGHCRVARINAEGWAHHECLRRSLCWQAKRIDLYAAVMVAAQRIVCERLSATFGDD
jgi:hypothetical protein